MCTVAAGVGIVQAGTGIFGAIAGNSSATRAAYQQQLYNAQVEAQQERYRAELIRYQNVTYKQDIDYGHEVLSWQKDEFSRQDKLLNRSVGQIEQNRFTQYATMLQRMVEEQIASAFDVQNVDRQSRKMAASAQVKADARGTEGQSIEQIINDVARQAGDATTVLELNRSATMRQLNLEMMGLKAGSDQALYNLNVGTYSPQQPLKAPQPVSPVTPAAPVQMPSSSALAVNVVGSVLSGVNAYNSLSRNQLKL
ncbi:virion core protein, T7 gp14 family [Azorhizobium caulinodans]|nr:hypothetical protein [Azorhizobium caulinodans]